MEIELKLAPVTAETAIGILENEPFYISGTDTAKMDACYYDTPARDLKKHGISLRLRSENDKTVCCLKIRVSDSARHEFEEEAASITQGISALCLRDDVPETAKQLIRTDGLTCLFSSDYTRTLRLARSGSSVIEVTFDSGYLRQDDRCCAVSEMELELKEGDPADLDALCIYLQAKYSLSLSRSTKAGRAAALTRDAFKQLTPVDTACMTEADILQAFRLGRAWRRETPEGFVYYKTDKY